MVIHNKMLVIKKVIFFINCSVLLTNCGIALYGYNGK